MPLQAFSPVLRSAVPSEIAFTVGGIDFFWKGILLAFALLAALLLVYLEARRKQMPPDTTIDLCLVLIPSGILGARLWYVLANRAQFSGSFLSMLRFWDGGLTVYGALLFGLLGLFVYAMKAKQRFFRLLDTLTPGLLAALAIVLWCDYFSQSGFGTEITDPNRMWFPLAVLIERTDTIHYAIFFYEFLWCVLSFAFCWFIVRKRARREGSVFLWAVLLYCAGHAAFNALRAEQAPSIPMRVILIVLSVVALLLLLLQTKRPLSAREGDAVIKDARPADAASNDPEGDAAEQEHASADDSKEPEEPEPGAADAPASEANTAPSAVQAANTAGENDAPCADVSADPVACDSLRQESETKDEE